VIKAWVNDVNTTSLRIAVSVALAAIAIILVLIGILFRNWLPTEQQLTVLKGVALFLAVMMGLDVAQFIGKRFSDAGYAAAKNPSPVNVEAPSTVSVSAAAPASEGVGAPAAPAQPAPLAPSRRDATPALQAVATEIDPARPVGVQVEGEGD
jgi:hypothetical protein